MECRFSELRTSPVRRQCFTFRQCLCRMYAGLTLFLFLSFLSLPAVGKEAGLPPDELAWQELVPEIEVFWHEYQTSPHRLSEEVWPFISSLKDFISRYPDSSRIPEAYYILGEAYASASYWPEAVAHWKIVIRYHPDSKWTSTALNSLVAYLEKQGDKEKLKEFYKDILRQFPDSVAAKTTRVLLARHALQEGKVELVKRVIREIEKSSPSADVEIPELLDLKALIARREGRRREAIMQWIHFINLKKSPVTRAAALFQIAETYRAAGDWLKARKYYALIRRDYSNQPEALFARFRMLQMSEQQKERLAKYVKGRVRPVNLYESEMVFREIVQKYPHYPLTQEVRKELIATKIKKRDYMEALQLADDFLSASPRNMFAREILSLSEQAVRRLGKEKFDTVTLGQMVSLGKKYLNRKARNRIQELIRKVTQELWIRLMDQLVLEKAPLEALEQYWSYRKAFSADPAALGQALGNAVKALGDADRQFLASGRYADLINYYFFHEEEIRDLRSPLHYHLLARAFSGVGLERMALRAYFIAWKLHPDGMERCEILRNWTAKSLDVDELKMTQDIVSLLDMVCPDYSLLPDVLYLKSVMASRQGDWIAAFNMAKDSLSIRADEKNVYQAMRAGIKLGEWKQVEKIYSKNGDLMPVSRRIDILKEWGDEAVRLSDFKNAMVPYRLVAKIDPEDPSVKFRMAVAVNGASGFEKARSAWEELSGEGRGIWGKAAKSELSFYRFMSGSVGQL